MGPSLMQLQTLQGHIKKDAIGYTEEFRNQYQHMLSLSQVFELQPQAKNQAYGEAVAFVAQVCHLYPQITADFPAHLLNQVSSHANHMDFNVRKQLVQALICIKNRQLLPRRQTLPVLFSLFSCKDKSLRRLIHGHIISDITRANKKATNVAYNREVQNFLYPLVAPTAPEASAKRALAVATDCWRKQLWRDARSANVIAECVLHNSQSVLVASIKFFLGNDELDAEGDGSDDEEDGGDGGLGGAQPSREDLYKAYNKGTISSKRKKQRKLARVLATARKSSRRSEQRGQEGFAAIHLLHDPHTFSQRLFTRLQQSTISFDTRLAMLQLLTRVVAVHKVLLLNLYPYLQRYIFPAQREAPALLACVIQAVHEHVPPDVLAPVLRQVVDQFVHDKARPEVITLGLKAVRELCVRQALVMTPELLQDLVEYRRHKVKQVGQAARGLVGLFREVQPEMLMRKDRGRGAEVGVKLKGFGEGGVADRVEGVELLEEAERMGGVEEALKDGEEEEEVESDVDVGEVLDRWWRYKKFGTWGGSERTGGQAAGSEGEGGEEGEEGGSEEDEVELGDSQSESDDEGGEVEEEHEQDVDEEHEQGGQGVDGLGEGEEAEGARGSDESSGDDDDSGDDEEPTSAAYQVGVGGTTTKGQPPTVDSLSQLRKQLANLKRKRADTQTVKDTDSAAKRALDAELAVLPLEQGRILTQEDLEAIQQLKRQKLVKQAMQRHGLMSVKGKKAARARMDAEEWADEQMEVERQGDTGVGDKRLVGENLQGTFRSKATKAERMESIRAGREGNAYGAASNKRKNKSGGLSNKEQARNKNMPIVARINQIKRRANRATHKPKRHHPRSFNKGKNKGK